MSITRPQNLKIDSLLEGIYYGNVPYDFIVHIVNKLYCKEPLYFVCREAGNEEYYNSIDLILNSITTEVFDGRYLETAIYVFVDLLLDIDVTTLLSGEGDIHKAPANYEETMITYTGKDKDYITTALSRLNTIISPNESKNVKIIREPIKSIKDILKSKSSDMVKVDFKFKVATKQLSYQYTSEIVEDIIVVMEDVSFSMRSLQDMVKVIHCKLLETETPILYYRFGANVQSILLTDRDEKLAFFLDSYEYEHCTVDYKKVVDHELPKDVKLNIIIITDSEDKIEFDSPHVVTCVSNKFSQPIKRFVDKTKGNYIII